MVDYCTLSPIHGSGEDAKFDFLLRRPSAIKETQFEDSILSINAAMSHSDLRIAICSGLHSALLNVIKTEALIFSKDRHSLVYDTDRVTGRQLKNEGVIWKVIRQRQMEIFLNVEEIDPLWDILQLEEKALEDRVGLIVPIVNRNELKVIAVMIAVCDYPTDTQQMKVEWIQKNSLIAQMRIEKYNLLENEKTRAEGMLKVCGSLMDFEISFLSIKINAHLRSLVNCKVCLLFVADEATLDLVSYVFGEKPINKEIRIPIEDSIYGASYNTSSIIIVNDASKDPRINPTVDFKFIEEYEYSSMMCIPVIGRKSSSESSSTTLGVAVCLDKEGDGCFTDDDRDSVQYTLKFCSSMISNTLAYQRELTLKKQNEALLNIAKNLFTRLNDPDVLLHAIMEEARELIKSEKCSLFLVEKESNELVATVFDSAIPGKNNTCQRLRIPIGQGIAGYVAQSGETVNIKDAYKHPMFYKEVDKSTGFKTRNILCIPIINNEGLVGVAQLVNKRNGRFFTMVDEELAKAFSVYCGISIYHSLLYKNVVTEQSRSLVATELMVYHMQVQTNDVDQLALESVPSTVSFDEQFCNATFSPRSIPLKDTPMVIISMAQEMDFLQKWKISRQKLAKFILMVKHGYREMPYHNWSHAIDVTHFCFLLYKHCDRLSNLSDLERLALFISCLCHDIDHRGTNNAFQVSSNSVLASLYSSKGSVMERHHLAQTFCILNSRGCNILENLSPLEYREILDLIRDNILATDLAIHLGVLKEIELMIKEGYVPNNTRHRHLLNSLIMTSCDLAGSTTKDWESSQSTSKLIYEEFFHQGDLEKALGVTPSVMMDREKASIPEQQLNFLNFIVQPVYRSLAAAMPSSEIIYNNLLENKKKWEELKQLQSNKTIDE